jgi:23S rRNA pseudouridine1911/1915/1917 synthase
MQKFESALKTVELDRMANMKKTQDKRRMGSGLILLYEDQDILVVDKPAGLLSIATGNERDRTAYWILSEYLRRKGERRRAAVVHRLDRDTSGVMLFAKSEPVKRRLMETWNTAVTERRYLALVEGELGSLIGSEGLINAPLGEDLRGKMVVTQGGLRALTRWKLLKIVNGYSLVSLELETGRRNQIRAHLDHIGHPVAGDRKYQARTDPLRRLCLHAERLCFHHPHDGRIMEFTVPAPKGFWSGSAP